MFQWKSGLSVADAEWAEKAALRKLFVKAFLSCQRIATEEANKYPYSEKHQGIVFGFDMLQAAFEEELESCGQNYTLEDLAK